MIHCKTLNPVSGLQHDHRVTPYHHHADPVLVSLLGELDRIIQDQIHERVKTTQGTFYLKSISYQLLFQ